MRTMGIDIGTTTISVILVDGESGALLGSRTIPHQAFIKGELPGNRVQDPHKLVELTKKAVCELSEEAGAPDCIGLTGQMHGVLYVNAEGQAVTPLYTWQDESGNEKTEDGRTYADTLKTVGAAAAGYGLTTHFYLQKNGKIPAEAVKMTTISDYVGMQLCGRKEPVIARDMAASWGCFDLKRGDFRRKELEDCGVNIHYLPEILADHGILGRTVGDLPKDVPVTVSLGDNQASVLGSVQDLCNTVLINIGTGSQVSVGIDAYYAAEGSIELRPCTEKAHLLVGSGLCGGRAYAMLEQFYREIIGLNPAEEASDGNYGPEKGKADMSSPKTGSLYAGMERQARAFLAEYGRDAAWKIRTTFSGTRSNPRERGSIQEMSVDNFCPGAMTVGMIQGILKELQEMYLQMTQMTGKKAARLVGSGNGIRRNALMQELAEELFGMKMQIPVCREEAAYGAALQAMYAAGFAGSLEEAQSRIQYLEAEHIR